MDRQLQSKMNGQPERRRILVYGAGVLGSVYAGKLHQAGYDVTLLARGERLRELHEHGLVLVDDSTGKFDHFPVPTTEHLGPEDAYDLVIVVVRKNQIPSVLPVLAGNHCTPNVLFLLNNAAGPAQLVEALGRERVILGFPGGGGMRIEGIVRYRLASRAQPTTIGELDGRMTARMAWIAGTLSSAGLPVAISNNMDAWLKTHVALISPIANALYLANGSNYRLARTRDGLLLMVCAIKEGLRVLRALRIPITPPSLQLLAWLPNAPLVALLQRRLPRPGVELVLSGHANSARDEMRALAEELRGLARQSCLETPAIDALSCYLDPTYPPLPDGQSKIELDWRTTYAGLALAMSAAALVAWLLGWLVQTSFHQQRR